MGAAAARIGRVHPSRVIVPHDSYYINEADADATPKQPPACGPPNIFVSHVKDVIERTSAKVPSPNVDACQSPERQGGAGDGMAVDAAPGTAPMERA